ncbi:hypothetical protein HDE_00630 [Halotydeus destructor]|nr:hypothetical protein HDE_00630 [Halotydeus destructor]
MYTQQRIFTRIPGLRDDASEYYHQMSTDMFRGLNYTVRLIASMITLGIQAKNGNYTGLIGLLQNDEVDFALRAIRLDAIPDHPVHVTTALASGEALIVSKKQDNVERNAAITDVVNAFQNPVLEYVLLATSMCFILLGYSLILRSERNRKYRNVSRTFRCYVRNLVKIYFKLIELLFDQENFKLKCNKQAGRIIWIFLGHFYFLVMFGYLLNYLSVDKVTVSEPDNIRKLSDQLRMPFNETKKPACHKNFNIYAHLLNARKGSQLDQLYQLIVNGKNLKDFNQAVGMGVPFSRDMRALMSGQISLVVEALAYHRLIRYGQCGMTEDSHLIMTSETFADGVLAFFVNKKMAPPSLRFAEYRMKVMFESHLTVTGMHKIGQSLAEKYFQVNYKNFRCYHHLWEKDILHAGAEDGVYSAYSDVTADVLHKTLMLCHSLSQIGVFVLIIELLIQLVASAKRNIAA